MKNFKFLGLSLLVFTSLFLIQCTTDPIPGVPGEDGADGLDGMDGVNGTTECAACQRRVATKAQHFLIRQVLRQQGKLPTARVRSETEAQIELRIGILDQGGIKRRGRVVFARVEHVEDCVRFQAIANRGAEIECDITLHIGDQLV